MQSALSFNNDKINPLMYRPMLFHEFKKYFAKEKKEKSIIFFFFNKEIVQIARRVCAHDTCVFQ